MLLPWVSGQGRGGPPFDCYRCGVPEVPARRATHSSLVDPVARSCPAGPKNRSRTRGGDADRNDHSQGHDGTNQRRDDECRERIDDACSEAGFTLTADDDTWKRLVRGESGVVDGMMSGQFDGDGDMQKPMRYSQAAVRLTRPPPK